jgi:hypothetical protein
MARAWIKMRVVVELPVFGDYSESDLRWDVERLIRGREHNLGRDRSKPARFGRVEVKRWSRVQARRVKRTVVTEPLD